MAGDRLSRPPESGLSVIEDPIVQGLARGWRAHDASTLDRDVVVETDVAIIGTGAGGGTAAEILTRHGRRVVLIEEGPFFSSSRFHMLESEAYPTLYQESAGRQTADKGIVILQGRSVGGSTTVNWTTSLRTPPETLAFWQQRFGLDDYTPEALAPWFAEREERLNVHPWTTPNENNSILQRGAKKLGIPTRYVPRNVRGCWNLGYCGLGCPTNAKQSMLVTTIPAALDRGAELYSRLRAERLIFDNDRVTALECHALDASGLRPSGTRVTLYAKHFVLAGGAIGSPALLLRSSAPDPYGVLGTRTFLHPTVISVAVMPEPVEGYSGAPQSVYCDHFLTTQPIDGPLGYKLEVPPLQPALFATTIPGFGPFHAQLGAEYNHIQVTIALLRDGFHPASIGGTVHLRSDGSPVLDYKITEPLWEAARRALVTMARIQFAAGATRVLPVHESAKLVSSVGEAESLIAGLPLDILRVRVASAHVMGGCGMGADPHQSVVDGTGRHHHVENLHVFDGSTFPTSLGANPQLSIYAAVARNATRLATANAG